MTNTQTVVTLLNRVNEIGTKARSIRPENRLLVGNFAGERLLVRSTFAGFMTLYQAGPKGLLEIWSTSR